MDINADTVFSILMQLPLVGLFIWYSDRKDKQFQEFLREERAARGEQLRNLTDEIKILAGEVREGRK
jgi:hypothetical protein